MGYIVIVVTNQPVIARGEVTIDELDLIEDNYVLDVCSKEKGID